MFRLIRWILHHFDYEVVSFAMMAQYDKAVSQRNAIAVGSYDLAYCVRLFDDKYVVRTVFGSPVTIVVKWFRIEDYGSEEYAYACAQELCDKLNERL